MPSGKHKTAPKEIVTNELCCLGCGQIAKFERKNGKKYCSDHSNKCPEKRRKFSEEVDHSEYSKRSLETRTRKNITKTSQIKGAETRRKNGHYERLAKTMQKHWIDHPWEDRCRSKWNSYKNTDLKVQSENEFNFIQKLEDKHGILWIIDNVRRGTYLWYIDPKGGSQRMYFPDFKIKNTIYEIKSRYTWDKKGTDSVLRERNEAKLNKAIEEGFEVFLILDGEDILWRGRRMNSCGLNDIDHQR